MSCHPPRQPASAVAAEAHGSSEPENSGRLMRTSTACRLSRTHWLSGEGAPASPKGRESRRRSVGACPDQLGCRRVPGVRRCSMLLGLALVVMPARASAAEEVAFRLDYKPVRGCMALDTLALFLEGDFGYRVVHDDARALVRITVKGSGRKMEAHVSALDDAGVERWQAVIPGPIDCRELMQDTAYAISLNLGKWELRKQATPPWLLRQPTIEVGSPAPSPPPRPFVAFDDGPLRVRAPDPLYATVTPPAEPPAGPRWELGATALFTPYGLPRIGFGGSLSLTARWPRFSLGGEFRGAVSLARDEIDAERTVMLSGLLVPCLETDMRLSLCTVGSVGRVEYVRPSRAEYQDAFGVAGLLGVRTGYTVDFADRWRLRPFVEGLVPVGASPQTVKYRNQTVRKEPWGSAIINIGLFIAVNIQ